jgi:hypothetical protein
LNRQPIFLVLGGHGRRGDLPHLHLAPKCGMQPMWSISNLCNLQLTAYYIHILYIRYIYLYIIIYIYLIIYLFMLAIGAYCMSWDIPHFGTHGFRVCFFYIYNACASTFSVSI